MFEITGDDIAALNVGLNVVKAVAGQRLAQGGHRDPVAGAEVDAPQQRDLNQNNSSWPAMPFGKPR